MAAHVLIDAGAKVAIILPSGNGTEGAGMGDENLLDSTS
jgi:hypothetical protein